MLLGYILIATICYCTIFALMARIAGVRVPVVRQKLAVRRARSQFRYIQGGKR